MISRIVKLMGNRFVISVDQGEAHIDAAIEEIYRIEALLTTYSDNSVTSKVNAMAGIQAVEVPEEFLQLITRAQRISELTLGLFDLSYGSIDKRLWNFDKNLSILPSKEAKQNLKLVNYKNIQIDQEKSTVFLKEKGMRIGFGGIGKGYAADKAVAILKQRGVKNGVVNASGDLKTWGRCDGKPRTNSIADPDAPQYPFSQLEVGEMAVATSGPYEKYAIINGKRYSHTIDPRTGLPISGLKSVTVICPHAELADAMTTPLSILGVKDGLNLINQMNQIACILVDDHNRVYTSNNIRA